MVCKWESYKRVVRQISTSRESDEGEVKQVNDNI